MISKVLPNRKVLTMAKTPFAIENESGKHSTSRMLQSGDLCSKWAEWSRNVYPNKMPILVNGWHVKQYRQACCPSIGHWARAKSKMWCVIPQVMRPHQTYLFHSKHKQVLLFQSFVTTTALTLNPVDRLTMTTTTAMTTATTCLNLSGHRLRLASMLILCARSMIGHNTVLFLAGQHRCKRPCYFVFVGQKCFISWKHRWNQ